jgi:hypothetical protein
MSRGQWWGRPWHKLNGRRTHQHPASSAALPTLPHIVIGSLRRNDESTCRGLKGWKSKHLASRHRIWKRRVENAGPKCQLHEVSRTEGPKRQTLKPVSDSPATTGRHGGRVGTNFPSFSRSILPIAPHKGGPGGFSRGKHLFVRTIGSLGKEVETKMELAPWARGRALPHWPA